MDRKTLIAIILCMGIFLGWQKYYIEPRLPKTSETPSQTQTTAAAPAANSAGVPTTIGTGATTASMQPAATQPARPAKTETIAAPTGDAILGDGAYLLKSWKLKEYREALAPEAASVTLQTVTHADGEVDLAFDDRAFAYLSAVQGTLSRTAQGGVLWSYEDANIKLTREVMPVAGQPYLDVRINADFKTKKPQYAFVSVSNKHVDKDHEEQDRILSYWTNDAIERVHVKDPGALKQIPTTVKYIATSSRYFMLALVSQSPIEAKGLVQPTNDGARVSLVYPIGTNSLSIPMRMYFGPKVLDSLRAVDPKLAHVVDLGWFEVIALPILDLMKWLYHWVKNYGVAIIILTIILKLVTFPLTYKSMKSMKEMARLQPQLQKLRERHADDKEALNREMLTLMRSHGYNPLAGCLPILIQMPVFFALYRVLYSSIELYQAPFALWIKDLSAPDHFYVFPILLSITMYIQQKLTPNTATDPVQAKMIQFMPLIFGAFMLTLPSGLTVYMLTNALASIIQQIILNKKLDMGHAPGKVARA